MSDELELDQEDFRARLLADSDLTNVTVLLQREGVTEQDILQALSVLNERNGKIGACIVVLMPSLESENPSAPTPLYEVQLQAQVFEQPLFSQDAATGVLKSAEQIAQRVRQIGHLFSTGRGGSSNQWRWVGMTPEEAAAGIVSYSVLFRRKAGDPHLQKVATPIITATPALPDGFDVEITCATVGAAIQRSIDGSYPKTAHEVPSFHVAAGTTIRAAATLAGKQQSNVAELTPS